MTDGRRRSGSSTNWSTRGCRAAGYRLTGDTLDHICCRHLHGRDRMLIMWEDDDHAVVVLIAQHDRGAADIYGTLVDALNVEIPEAELYVHTS